MRHGPGARVPGFLGRIAEWTRRARQGIGRGVTASPSASPRSMATASRLGRMPAPTARARSLCRLTSSWSALRATQDLVPLPGVKYVRPPGRRLKQRVEEADDRDTAATARRATPSAKTTSTSAPKRPRSPSRTFPRQLAATTTPSSSPTRVARTKSPSGSPTRRSLTTTSPRARCRWCQSGRSPTGTTPPSGPSSWLGSP